jgi:hypothetical protein
LLKREDLPQLAPRVLSEAEQKRLLRAIERTESVRDKVIAYTFSIRVCALRRWLTWTFPM